MIKKNTYVMGKNFLRFEKRRRDALEIVKLPKEITEEVNDSIPNRYSLESNMEVQCCYCKEFVKLPHHWVFDNIGNKVVGVYEKDGKRFRGWTDPFSDSYWYYRYHPHVDSDNIHVCMGDWNFSPGARVREALRLGLYPESSYFNVKEWLYAVGHQCDEMGPLICEEHGFNAYLVPEIRNNLFVVPEHCSRCNVDREYLTELKASPCCGSYFEIGQDDGLFKCSSCTYWFSYNNPYIKDFLTNISDDQICMWENLSLVKSFIKDFPPCETLEELHELLMLPFEAVCSAESFEWKEIPPGIEEMKKIYSKPNSWAYYHYYDRNYRFILSPPRLAALYEGKLSLNSLLGVPVN